MLKEADLRKRAILIQAIRRFFIDRGYIEVDTPLRLPVLIPEAHNQPVESGEHFLQTSPEICMKRLLAEAGCSKIFQICKCFRDKERGDRHLPEFTMLEWYRAHCDYFALMEECEELFAEVAGALGHSGFIRVKEHNVSLEKPWQRLSVADAFELYTPVSMAQALAQDSFDEMLCEFIEPRLGLTKPVFLYDYPIELAALARPKEQEPSLAERFEIYIGGIELANGFSELTDRAEQQIRFETELQLLKKQGSHAAKQPEKFLASLPQMPETAGIALGIDRLVMVLLGEDSIDGAVSFTPEDL